MALIKGKSSIFAILMIFAANRLKWNRGIFDHTLQLYHPFLNQWTVNSTYSSLTGLNLFAEGYCIKKDGSTAKYGNCGEDSYTLSLKKGGPSLIAVADGVGGWVTHGGDSSGVSNGMMKMMKKLHQESAKIYNLNGLIKLAFKSLKETRKFSKGNKGFNVSVSVTCMFIFRDNDNLRGLIRSFNWEIGHFQSGRFTTGCIQRRQTDSGG